MVQTYKQQFNKKYKQPLSQSNSLKDKLKNLVKVVRRRGVIVEFMRQLIQNQKRIKLINHT